MNSRAWRRRFERGEAETAEFTLAIVPLLILVMLIAVTTLIRPAQLPVFFAARECARAASVSLNQAIALQQGIEAAANSLRGNSLSTAQASVSVWSDGAWQRGDPVTCRVSYQIDVSRVPMVGAVFGVVASEAEASARIEPGKSRWGTSGP
jgi:Flp pilus assembly protein TadG